jgi:hypothetical protein
MQQRQFNAELQALTAAMLQQESGGQQFGPGGGVLTSRAGALGQFQLMPQTAAALRVNPYSVEGNQQGGLDLIKQLYDKYQGQGQKIGLADIDLVAIAYNGRPEYADRLLKGQMLFANLPSETQAYVPRVTGHQLPTIGPTTPEQAAMGQNVDVGLRGSQDTFTQQYAAQSRAVEALEKQLSDLDKLYEQGQRSPQEYAAAHSQLTDELLKQVTALNDMRTPVDQFIDMASY